MPHIKGFVEHPSYKIRPETRLGYQLGLNRNEPYKERRPDQNVFASESSTRMAGDKRVDIFTAERDYLRAPTARGDFLPNRFRSSISAPNLETSDG